MSLFEDGTMKILSKALDVAVVRNEAIANNIANSNTKGFKANRVIFEEKLKKALDDAGDDASKLNETIDAAEPEIIKDESVSMRLDGNNVDVEMEMSNLAANQLLYDALIQSASGKLSALRYVITGGGR